MVSFLFFLSYFLEGKEGAVLNISFRLLEGQCPMVYSRDGYCTLVTFDEILLAHHVQQHTIQLQSIANHHSAPLSYSTSSYSAPMAMIMTPMVTPVSGTIGLPAWQMPTVVVKGQGSGGSNQKSRKRDEPPLTPAASVDGGGSGEYCLTGDSVT